MSDAIDVELSSWKEIASYLGIAVRTAQLWERERKLPVHRLPGGRGRVLASTAELDRWKASAAEVTASPPAAPETGAPQATSAEPERTSRVWMWTGRARLGVTVTACVICVAALTGMGAMMARQSPFAAKADRHALIVVDSQDRELWRRTFPQALAESDHPEMQAAFTWIGDLDDDGRIDVLFAPHSVGPSESGELICYDDRGNVRWSYRNNRQVHTADDQFSNIYGIAAFRVIRLGKGRGNAVLVSTTHELYYPSSAVLLSPRGVVLREYWHSGHLNHLQAADLNADGRPEFYLAGLNNARHAATVVVLDEDHFGGAAREPDDKNHQLLGFGAGTEVARILIPQSCLSRTFDPYNPVHRFTADAQGLLVETVERIGAGAGVYHHVSPDLLTRRADIGDAYRVEHRRAILDRYISESSCPLDSIPDVQFVAP